MLEPHPRAHPVRYQAIEAELGAAVILLARHRAAGEHPEPRLELMQAQGSVSG